jgi:hypothetical protein
MSGDVFYGSELFNGEFSCEELSENPGLKMVLSYSLLELK